MPKVTSKSASDAYATPDSSTPATPSTSARRRWGQGAGGSRPPGMPSSSVPRPTPSAGIPHSRPARRQLPGNPVPQPPAQNTMEISEPSNDGGWGRVLEQLGELEEPPSLSHCLVLTTTPAGQRLAWAPPTGDDDGPDAAPDTGAKDARELLKSVIIDAILALPDADINAPGILFPEQDADIFRRANDPLDAMDVKALAGRIRDRLALYDTPPTVTLRMPLTAENRGMLLPFLDKAAPGSYLSAQSVGHGEIVLTSRLIRTPGADEALAQQALMQLFDHAWHQLEGVGTGLPPQQRDDLKSDFAEEPLTASSAVGLLNNIPMLAQDRRLSTQRDAVDAPSAKPTPTEAIAWLVDMADQSARLCPDMSALRAHFIWLGQQAMSHWLTDRLDTTSTVAFLTVLQQRLLAIPHPLLQRAAAAIGDKVAGLQSHGATGPAPTRLNDNVYGRKWETAFAEVLAEKPSQGMLSAATTVRRLLSTVHARCTPAQQRSITQDTVNRIQSAYPGSWLAADPASAQLLEYPDRASVLKAFLNTSAHDGASCMATYLVVCRLLAAIQEVAPDIATWKAAADTNYDLLLDERGEDKFPKDAYQQGPDVGMLMRHQISPNFMNYDEEDDVRGVLSSVIDFDARTPAIDAALRTGRPSIWGSSGTTNLLLHFLADALQHPATANAVRCLDIKHMILGLATMVMRDGGHSLREVLRVLEQTADRLPDPVRQPLTPSPAPASHYGAFFASFAADIETTRLLHHGNEQAWQSTLDYRRELASELRRETEPAH